jgi:geranylgeranyl diphosphate synthase type II
MQAGGKRLRPYITLLSYGMNGHERNIDDILPAAAAQEMLHMAMLIHDDIIDRDQIRYGVKNVAGQYDEHYGQYVENSTERLHFSNSAAIIAGDLLISEAYALIQKCKIDAAHIAKAQSTLSQAIFNVVGGELLDTESAFMPFDQIDALTIAHYKTASYSFVSPLTMGAQLADMPADVIQKLEKFGIALGIAYQLQDDILGFFGDEIVTGKSVSSDITEGKHTHLVEQFYRLANPDQISEFATIFNNRAATNDQLEQARKLLQISGAVEAILNTIGQYANQARLELDDITMNDDARSAFLELIERCTARVK